MFQQLHVAPPRSATGSPAIALHDVRKVYGRGEGTVVALDSVTVGLEAGSFTAVMGASGSGKSTFLHVAAGPDRPASGAVLLGGTEVSALRGRRPAVLPRPRTRLVFPALNPLP